MIKVIAIGTDRNIFKEGSSVRSRLLKQATLFEELHVVVFSLRKHECRAVQLGSNLWIYPTNSFSRWLYIRDAIELARALVKQRNLKTDNAVVTAQDPFECGFAAFRIAKRANLSLHIQIHTDVFSPYFESLSRLNIVRLHIARRILPRASGIRTVSFRVAESVRRNVESVANKVSVLPVFSEHAQKWASKPLRRFKKDEGEDSCLALMITRLAPEKDIFLALDALNLALDSDVKLGLVVAGEGEEEQNIRDRIQERGLSGRVRMELWQSDPSSLYRVCDVLLLTSRFEGFGLTLLEAAVHGQAIITTDVGIARELIPEAYHRFICQVGDSNSLSERLKELARDVELRRKYGNALRASAKQFLISEKEYYERYREDLERCVNKKDDRTV